MAAKKKEAGTNVLPLKVDHDPTAENSITYANEVVAIIAGLAANEVEGIAGMNGSSGSSILSKNRNATRGVKVEIGTEEVGVDLYVTVEYGTPIQRAAMDAQESVRKAIENMTGLHVARVDVHVQGVSFEKENNLLQAGAESAMLEAGKDSEPEPAAKSEIKPAVKPSRIPAEDPAPDAGMKSEAQADAPEAKDPSEPEAAASPAATPAAEEPRNRKTGKSVKNKKNENKKDQPAPEQKEEGLT